MIRPGQLRKWFLDSTLFLVLSAVNDERIEKYGVKHWLVFLKGTTTYRRESSINEGSVVISEPD